MNFVAPGSVSRDSNSVRWEVEKPTVKLFVGWSGTIAAFTFFAAFLCAAEWIPIKAIAVFCIVFLSVFAGNLILAIFGEHRALVLRSGNELFFNLGFPYHLLDRETPKVKSIRDAFFMKTIARVEVEDVLSVVCRYKILDH